MKYAAGESFDFDIFGTEQGVCAAKVKKCPVARALFGHHIGIGSRGFVRQNDIGDIHAELAESLENISAVLVVSDDADARKRERGFQFRQIGEDVCGRAAGAPVLGV